MLFLANALIFGWIASFWSKTGLPNIFIAAVFSTMAIINASAAAPTVAKWIGM